MVISRTTGFLGIALLTLVGRSSFVAACGLPQYETVFVPSGTVPDDAFAAEIGDPARSAPTLTDASGAAVALTVVPGPGARFTVRPTQALIPGAHYTFRYNLGRAFKPEETVPQTVDIVAGPATPVPETAGALRVQVDPVATSSALQTFHILWDRAPALDAYRPLLEMHYLIDEQPLSDLNLASSSQNVDRVCDRPQPVIDSCGEIMGVLPGHHVVTLTVRVYGSAAPLPVLTTAIDVQCQAPVPFDQVPDRGC
ncbi:MAG TPA: hypothetical protein VHU40_18285, partial [Polyangia bacterium]|nr:hypothetical protein [Polyangia bacterium]